MRANAKKCAFKTFDKYSQLVHNSVLSETQIQKNCNCTYLQPYSDQNTAWLQSWKND